MAFLIGLLTVIMVLDCIVLIFLVLIQLPKKEAGAGLAFGASATDALFGAGSGTVLTKITKYAAAIFFGLAVLLSVMQTSYSRRSSSRFNELLGKPITAAPSIPQQAKPGNLPGGTQPSAPVLPAPTNAGGLLSVSNIP